MTANEIADLRCWYVVRLKPKQELRAESNLRAWGIDVFAPRIRRLLPSRASIECTRRVEALFPGYIFACFDLVSFYTKIRFTRGVYTIVGFGGWATAVDDAVIDALKGRVEEDGFVRVDEPQRGDVVEIVDGPLRSLTGVFDSALNGRDRVRVLLTTLECGARVEVPKAFVRRTAAHFVA